MIWLRAGLVLAIVAIAALAVSAAVAPAPPPAEPVALAPEPSPRLAPTPAPTLASTRVPLPTFEQRVISRVARETPEPGPTATPSSELIVSIVDNGYLPSQLVVPLGSRVRWVNTGSDG